MSSLLQSVLSLAVLSIALTGCKSLRLERPLQEAATDWRTEAGDGLRNSLARSDLIPPLEQAWIYNAQAGFGAAAPLISGNVVFVATRRGEVHALNLTDGKRRGSKNFGNAIEGTPVLTDREIFLGLSWGSRVVKAYDFSNGRLKWDRRGAPVRAGILRSGNNVIVADIEGTVRAFEQLSGEVLWTNYTDTTAILASPAATAEGGILVSNISGRISLLSREGGVAVWSRLMTAPLMVSPLIVENMIIAPTARGSVQALDLGSAVTLWEFALPDTLVKFGPAAVSGRFVVAGASDGHLRAFDRDTGELVWQFKARGNFVAAPVISGNVVYAGAMDRHLYAFDLETGRPLWKEELRGRIKSNMAIADGYLVVKAEPRFVYGFRTGTK